MRVVSWVSWESRRKWKSRKKSNCLAKKFFNCRFVPDLETQLPFLPLCSRNDETTGSLLHQYPQRPSMAIIENFKRADYFVALHFVQLFEWTWKPEGEQQFCFVFFIVSQTTTLFIPPVSSPFFRATQNKTTACDQGSSRWDYMSEASLLEHSGGWTGSMEILTPWICQSFQTKEETKEKPELNLCERRKRGELPTEKGIAAPRLRSKHTLAPMIRDWDRRQHDSSHWFVLQILRG